MHLAGVPKTLVLRQIPCQLTGEDKLVFKRVLDKTYNKEPEESFER